MSKVKKKNKLDTGNMCPTHAVHVRIIRPLFGACFTRFYPMHTLILEDKRWLRFIHFFGLDTRPCPNIHNGRTYTNVLGTQLVGLGCILPDLDPIMKCEWASNLINVLLCLHSSLPFNILSSPITMLYTIAKDF